MYDRYHMAAPGSFVWEFGLFANFKPGKQDTWVNYGNDERAPLLFIAGGSDHIMPPSVNKSNYKHWKKKSKALTKYAGLPGRSHWTCAEPGWEEVADLALSWAVGPRRRPRFARLLGDSLGSLCAHRTATRVRFVLSRRSCRRAGGAGPQARAARDPLPVLPASRIGLLHRWRGWCAVASRGASSTSLV